MSASEAQIKSEIARLTGTLHDSLKASESQHHDYYLASINQHKLGKSTAPGLARRSNTYVNPSYKPANMYIRPNLNPVSKPPRPTQPQPPSTQVKDVVLNGIAFESSGRSLVRKDRK